MGENERIELGQEVHGAQALPGALFTSRALDAGFAELRTESWPTSATELPETGNLVVRVRGGEHEALLSERDGLLVQLELMPGYVSAAVAGADAARVDELMEWLRTVLPAPDPSARHEVQVTFWTYSPRGPIPAWRSIAVPEWSEINENYEPGTRAKLGPLMSGFQPARGGQLILWHGRAGTGKTYALRALAWEWRRWCEFHYIVDPDRFFGEHADYLMNVLVQPTFAVDFDEGFTMAPMRAGASQTLIELPGGGTENDEERSKAWKLLMLEDTGELLTPDARSVIGQGLSRFLNVVDGLIGQGLRVLVLVTTNEEIRALHPAVARPGRAAANVEFRPVPANEANAWLEGHGSAERVTEQTTLASLYAILEGIEPGTARPAAGFGG